MDYTRTTARYSILYKRNSFNVTGRKNVLPPKSLIGEALSLTSLLPAEGGRDKGV